MPEDDVFGAAKAAGLIRRDGGKIRMVRQPPDELAVISTTQQLVARIKKSSKYYGQTEPGLWFDVRVVRDSSYHLRGNNNNYQLRDVVLGMRLAGGEVIDLASGKSNWS